MRPVGDIRSALLSAAPPLSSDAPGVTVREMSARAQVGFGAGIATVKNMKRAGVLCITGRRKVPHARRPVAEYKRTVDVEEQTTQAGGTEAPSLAEALKTWSQK